MDSIELLNEETTKWFENGIKRITGESLYLTKLGEPDNNRVTPVAQMGTIVKIPFGIINPVAPATIIVPDEWSIIAHSGTKIIVRPKNQNCAINNVRINLYDVHKLTWDEVTNNPYSGAWQSFPLAYVGLVSELTILQRHKTDGTGYYNEEQLGDYGNGRLTYHAGERKLVEQAYYEQDIRDTSALIKTNYRFSIENDIYYVDCVWIDDPTSEALYLVPLIDGYTTMSSSSVNDFYSGNYIAPAILGNYGQAILGTIPYSYLNNTNYFDPETDGTDPLPNPDDPGFSGDTSTPGGGGGNYINYPSDDIGLPALPTVSAIDTGFLTMYNPSSSQLQDLVNYLWTSDWLETVKKMVSNPMDAIVSLQLAPYSIGSTASSTCKIGAVTTDIAMNKVTGQYITLDAGSVPIPEHWGNALDYNNVNISIYIPFVGIRSLDTNLCMNSTLSLTYYVDKLTGSAIAMLMVSKNASSKSIYYTYDCNVNYQIPVTGANYAETIKAIMSLTASSVGFGASVATGNIGGAMTAGSSMIGSAFMAGSGACHYEGSGNLSANTGMLSQFMPYVIVELPKQSLPGNFAHMKGYTSNITSLLGGLSGYTEVSYIHLDGINCTDAEKEEIDRLLKSGVIL